MAANINEIKYSVLLNLKNIPGKNAREKIVVIEADDWGSIRMPSKAVFDNLTSKRFYLNNRYDKYDTLADEEDLSELFLALTLVKDKTGRNAIMTPMVNVCNPDFEKIKTSGFEQFYFEPFTKTLERYGRSKANFELWREGIAKKIFVPEYHGNSHVMAPMLLQHLKEGNKLALEAFEMGYIHPFIKDSKLNTYSFRPELFFSNPEHISNLVQNLRKGVTVFQDIFEYSPMAYAPTNSIFHPVFEKPLFDSGIRFLFSGLFAKVPDGKGGLKRKFYPVGKTGKSGLKYYMRNCAFEPTDSNYQGVALTIRQMEAAFRWNKPAIISTHRVNFIGSLNKSNRKKGIEELRLLLKTIMEKWPDVVFMSSAEMLQQVFEKKVNEG